MHKEAFEFAAQTLDDLDLPTIRALEIGARDFNGGVRELVERLQPEWYLGIDTAPGPGVDAIGDGSDYQPPIVPNLVLCTEVLEHTPHAREVVRQIGRVLEPGGFALITCATDPRAPHSGVDGYAVRAGEYYANVRPRDLDEWLTLAGLDALVFEVHDDRGDLYAYAHKPEASE
jgi:SAM-dependent methyltransferase